MADPKTPPKDPGTQTALNEDGSPATQASFNFQIRIQNTTTRAEVPEKPPCKLVQFLEKGLVLEVPIKACSKGHNLIIDVHAKDFGGRPNFKFSATGKVEEHQSFLSDTEQITVTFLQFNEADWKVLTGSVASRQEDIMNFFLAAKGK